MLLKQSPAEYFTCLHHSSKVWSSGRGKLTGHMCASRVVVLVLGGVFYSFWYFLHTCPDLSWVVDPKRIFYMFSEHFICGMLSSTVLCLWIPVGVDSHHLSPQLRETTGLHLDPTCLCWLMETLQQYNGQPQSQPESVP